MKSNSKCVLAAAGTLVAAGSTIVAMPEDLRAQVQVIEIECPSGTEPTYFGCQVPPPPGVNYVKNWGVLAHVASRDEWVFTTGHPKEGKARKVLASACKEAGVSCQVYVTFLNQCVAVARVDDPAKAGPGKDTIHNGSTYEEAQANAVASCKSDWGAKSCAPVKAQCSINRIER